jgi:methyl-accepting chemotaxis protein
MTVLKWATNPEANIKEPIDALKENGWQAGDIPTASNFNWLFGEIAKVLDELKERVAILDFVRSQVTAIQNDLSGLKQKSERMAETLNKVETTSDENKTASGHYKIALEEILHVLNDSRKGEKLGLEVPIHNDYPFKPRPDFEDPPGLPRT